jgi:hypothetical protein
VIGVPSTSSPSTPVSNPYSRYDGALPKSSAGFELTVTNRPPGLRQRATPRHIAPSSARSLA